jgi:hypothetical protein
MIGVRRYKCNICDHCSQQRAHKVPLAMMYRVWILILFFTSSFAHVSPSLNRQSLCQWLLCVPLCLQRVRQNWSLKGIFFFVHLSCEDSRDFNLESLCFNFESEASIRLRFSSE